jgi:uncharacterized protein (TIGR03086 family)
MTPATSSAVRVLEPAIRYALAAVAAVTPESLSHPTPCRGWDLRMLLRHASESLAAICEGIDAGCIDLYPPGENADVPSDPARAFRDRAGRLLDSCADPSRQHEVIHIAGGLLAPSVMAGAGALEIAVHGWDISRACGHCQPIPRAGRRPPRNRLAAGSRHRPPPPVRRTGQRAAGGQPQRPTGRIPRPQSLWRTQTAALRRRCPRPQLGLSAGPVRHRRGHVDAGDLTARLDDLGRQERCRPSPQPTSSTFMPGASPARSTSRAATSWFQTAPLVSHRSASAA